MDNITGNDCSFLIASSVSSIVYLSVSLDCSFLIASSVFSNVYLSGSLDCTFLIASSVFSNVYNITGNIARRRKQNKKIPLVTQVTQDGEKQNKNTTHKN
jgi:hypothetical protein